MQVISELSKSELARMMGDDETADEALVKAKQALEKYEQAVKDEQTAKDSLR